jgi:hypothetical protein
MHSSLGRTYGSEAIFPTAGTVGGGWCRRPSWIRRTLSRIAEPATVISVQSCRIPWYVPLWAPRRALDDKFDGRFMLGLIFLWENTYSG